MVCVPLTMHTQGMKILLCVCMLLIAGMRPCVQSMRPGAERVTKLSYCPHNTCTHMWTESVNRSVRGEDPWQSLIHHQCHCTALTGKREREIRVKSLHSKARMTPSIKLPTSKERESGTEGIQEQDQKEWTGK